MISLFYFSSCHFFYHFKNFKTKIQANQKNNYFTIAKSVDPKGQTHNFNTNKMTRFQYQLFLRRD